VKTILKSISNDDCLLNTFGPEDEDVFSLRLLLRIGAENSSEADNFDLFVCTPEWLCKHQWLPELMRHTLRARKNYQGSLPGNMKTISLNDISRLYLAGYHCRKRLQRGELIHPLSAPCPN